MKISFLPCRGSTFLLAVAVMLVPLSLSAEEGAQSISLAGVRSGGSHSKQKPAFMCFKEVVATREGDQRINFKITLEGEIPSDKNLGIVYYVRFDLDQGPSRGTFTAGTPDFGRDISFRIYREKASALFKSKSSTAYIDGRRREITLSGLRVSGSTIEVSARSELFRIYNPLRFYVLSLLTIYNKGESVSEIGVDKTPVGSL